MIKQSVLFLCTHNSARSQMAEGLINHLSGDRFQAFSAGTEPGTIHPLAVKVMGEIGIDISAYRSKHLREFIDREIDLVITVCDNARESCPFFPGAKAVEHKTFPDPANVAGNKEMKLAAFRSVRDALVEWIEKRFTATSKYSNL